MKRAMSKKRIEKLAEILDKKTLMWCRSVVAHTPLPEDQSTEAILQEVTMKFQRIINAQKRQPINWQA